MAVDLQTFSFTITPPSVASQCVLNYTITPTGSDGTILPDITVEVTDTEAPVTLTESGFDLCNNMYNFTVVANTFTGPGDRSAVSSPQQVDYLSTYVSSFFILNVT